MKTTKNVNIAGIFYVIDDDAYDFLTNYFADISSRLDDNQNKQEIISDIESRISEILKDKNIEGNRVITIEMAEYCSSIIGQPDVFGEVKNEDFKQTTTKKRLMRDVDDKLVGGVCSGVSAYFNIIDVSIIRITFALLLFLGGSGLIVYVVAWILIPAASTKEDKEMLKRMRTKNKI